MPGLSLGLLRLHDLQVISLSDESDATTTYEFVLSAGQTPQRFSHIDVRRNK